MAAAHQGVTAGLAQHVQRRDEGTGPHRYLEPAGHQGIDPGDVDLTNNSPSYSIHKGGEPTISICNPYSKSKSRGSQFGPIRNFISANLNITIVTSQTVCSGASDPVAKTGWFQCGKGYCIPQ